MREAVIVSTARTGIGRAFKGSLNHSKSPSMLGHVIAQAVQRAGIEGAEVEDVVMGTVLTSGTAGMNLARNAALAAGLPVTAPGQTMDRQCASGLMAIATAAKQVMVDGMDVVVAGGQENITAEQKAYFESAMASKPMVTCSPVERTASSSRGAGGFWMARARLSRRSVSPDIADTTTTRRWPSATATCTRSATAWIRSTVPTDVPPYF